MEDLAELAFRSEVKTEILKICLNLKDDDLYAKEDVFKDLLDLIHKMNL
ncbi:hypothetical protein M4A92_15770 [Caldibacillus thermoamylovorans]|nr:hypothetical protein [Caldibacillus thermoamylovorans]MCM3800053.1 hypothetical protein [Caldibacillus thermoamylovorans]